MPNIWQRIEDKVTGHRGRDAESAQPSPSDDGPVGTAPRVDVAEGSPAPPEVADETETNVGGAPRAPEGGGRTPAMVADENEGMVNGAPRAAGEPTAEETVDGAPRLGDEGYEGVDFRHRPQA